ncbi:MAG: protein-glutamate O-methyltransferase CheR [Henriciella sp.]|nr:protein-glutamate O-methyltransferase CheR [Henriciella sp.]
MQETTFNELADLALRQSGQSIPASKSYLMEARLSTIARRENFATLDDLVHCLKARPNPRFEQEVAAALTGKSTSFFGDRELLDKIVGQALPKRLEYSKTGRLRVWCAGVSTGQEAWSLAILLREAVGSPLANAEIEIIGTDLSTLCIETAKQGVYGHFDVQKGLSIHRLMTNFDRHDNGDWSVKPDLQKQVSFRRHNLLEPARDLGQFDIVMCCNVLNGLAKGAQQQVVETLSAHLLPDAFLFAGTGEDLQGISPSIKPSRALRGAFERDISVKKTEAA